METIGLVIHPWGQIQGKEVYLYEFSSSNGFRVSFTNYGATIQSFYIADKEGLFKDIVLGYDSLEGYIGDPFFIGSVIGRYANRISSSFVDIDGEKYTITTNEAGYHQHGGKRGFDKRVWEASVLPSDGKEDIGIVMKYLSEDGEEGFPGNVNIKVIYKITHQNKLLVHYTATTDKSTLINLTQHSYFNLAGHDSGTILSHSLLIPSTRYLPVNPSQIPIGILEDVTGTPFDFRNSIDIGEHIGDHHEQLRLSNGYDHSWVLKNEQSSDVLLAATVYEPIFGRRLKVYTSEPAVHLYTGNFLDASQKGKNNRFYAKRAGFCLETQNYPDAPNHAHFPSSVLKPGQVFESQTIFEFST